MTSETMAREFFTVEWPGKIVFGAGKLNSLAEEARVFGNRAFLVTTRDLTDLGFTERTKAILESEQIQVVVYDKVFPDPTCLAVDEAAAIAQSEKCDMVIALGGGSAIDFAKGVSVAATHDGPVWDYVTYTGANAKPVTSVVLPVIAIPTTAGTGSEVSKGTVLDNPQTHMKAALLSNYVYPKVALIDPELTYSMPKSITAMTGFDALTHGMEGYLNVARSNPCADLFCLETVRLVTEYLPRVIENGKDYDGRAKLSWAAALGGISIAISNATVAHAMGLPLGSRMHTPHGLGLSRLLPVVLENSWQVQPKRCAVLAEIVGVSKAGMSDEEKSQALVEWLYDFIKQIGLTDLWQEQDIDDAMLDQLTEDVFAYMGRPVQQHRPVFDKKQIRAMFEKALRV
jgi:alcohol dehydrogenase class IV